MSKPLMIDLYCGLGGWAEGGLAEGYAVIGFDIERRPYPGQLVLQDILTLDGRRLKDAIVIVASPPCQAYSYRAMPWKKAKALPPPNNDLFEACFRIQREACEAAGLHIPMVVENVRGAQKWVGKAEWHFGSYFLWGDVPALMPIAGRYKSTGMNWSDRSKRGQDFTRLAGRQALEGIKFPGNNGPRLWSERRIQRIRDENEHPFYNSSSNSIARKIASALIAKIPFPLAQHIARVYRPRPNGSAGES